jgi:hypothetical protein
MELFIYMYVLYAWCNGQLKAFPISNPVYPTANTISHTSRFYQGYIRGAYISLVLLNENQIVMIVKSHWQTLLTDAGTTY